MKMIMKTGRADNQDYPLLSTNVLISTFISKTNKIDDRKVYAINVV